jgi:hypothetical protein
MIHTKLFYFLASPFFVAFDEPHWCNTRDMVRQSLLGHTNFISLVAGCATASSHNFFPTAPFFAAVSCFFPPFASMTRFFPFAAGAAASIACAIVASSRLAGALPSMFLVDAVQRFDAPTPAPPLPAFQFGAVFSSNMVLQAAPNKAAVYGYAPPGATAVTVTLMAEGSDDGVVSVVSSIPSQINITVQPFGPDWGVLPCAKADCPPCVICVFIVHMCAFGWMMMASQLQQQRCRLPLPPKIVPVRLGERSRSSSGGGSSGKTPPPDDNVRAHVRVRAGV